MAVNYDIKKNKEQYIYDFILKYDIQDCWGFDDDLKLDSKARRLASKLNLDAKSISGKKAVKYLSMNIKRMSGGQKKLTNIVTNLIRYEFSDIILLDEPLNNLDYNNVRAFSNILTKIYRSKPELGIIVVTHCRSLPIVNRMIEIDMKTKGLKECKNYSCSACFGDYDENGFYK